MWLIGNWKEYCDELPPIYEEVIFYCKEWRKEWLNDDIFIHGTKIGIRTPVYLIISEFDFESSKYITKYLNPNNTGKRLFWTHKPKYDEVNNDN